MNKLGLIAKHTARCVTVIFIWLTPFVALANPPPGTDPIILSAYKPRDLNGPGAPYEPKNVAMAGRDGNNVTPGISARLARFDAKIMTLELSGSTKAHEKSASNSVINALASEANGAGGRVCVMDIGSVSTTASSLTLASGQSAQPVLIRGDVINICK